MESKSQYLKDKENGTLKNSRMFNKDNKVFTKKIETTNADKPKLFYEDNSFKLYQGSNLDILPLLEDNSIDSIVTDPPYELGFMGKSWDSTGIAYNEDLWKECLRVLKPGGHLIAFSGSRTYHWMAVAIEKAGFEIRDQLMWLYGTGFPKASDVGKAIEGQLLNGNSSKNNYSNLKGERLQRGNWGITKNSKEYGHRKKDYDYETDKVDRLGKVEYQTDEAKKWDGWKSALKPAHEPMVLARKPLEKGLSIAKNIIKWGVGALNIDESRIPFDGDKTDSRIGTDKILGESKIYKYSIEETKIINAWKTDKYDYIWSENNKKNILKTAKEYNFILPKKWENYEMVIFADYDIQHNNFIDYNYGKIAIPYEFKSTSKGIYEQIENGKKQIKKYKDGGRYPSNVIYDGSDEVADKFPNETNRFFYGAKATSSDRDQGLDNHQIINVYSYEDTQLDKDGNKIPIKLSKKLKQSYGYGNDNGDNLGERIKNVKRKNIHPTVKPTDLMRYLIRLVTPKNGVILDPFFGSGSTGKGAFVENIINDKNYKIIGIELTKEYLPIARDRVIIGTQEFIDELNKPKTKQKEVSKEQTSIFDLLEKEELWN